MVQRVTYRRHNNFNTRSNKVKVVKTPGGRLTLHVIEKAAKGPRCGDCKGPIAGIPCLRPFQYKRLRKFQRTISRAYGGSRCMSCTRDRVKRAFFIEEQKTVRAIVAEKEAETKKAEQVKGKKGKKEAKVEKAEKKVEKKTEKKSEKKTAPKKK